MSVPTNPHDVAHTWLSQFSSALSSGNVEGVVSCFLPDGYLRDVLVFTWDTRALHGHESISKFLTAHLEQNSQFSDIKLDPRPGLSPVYGPIPPSPSAVGVSAGFSFATPVATGQGYFHLLHNGQSAEADAWKALLVHVKIVALKGYEEVGSDLGVYGGHTLAWSDVKESRRKSVENDPQVIIIGAGQNGLMTAARFGQMGISALVVEANQRVGDNWRKRYPTLTLHTIKKHHEMLYQAFPKNWPTFTPRDKLANWLEQYAESQDIVVWTDSRPLPTPTYDFSSKKWTVTIDRAGHRIVLHPSHVVLAAGTLGAPRIPQNIRNKDRFSGLSFHSSVYAGGRDFAGKRAVVIGAGNTSADICQDLSFHGAASVTMVQRSQTCIVKAATINAGIAAGWPEDASTDICDFKFSAKPVGMFKKMLAENEKENWEREKDIHEGLVRAGMKLHMGDGAGPFPIVFERFGGYWLDVGCAQLIGSGKVKIKQGVEIDGFTEDSVVFTDGSVLGADVVIFATGYENVRDTMRTLFGDDTMDRTGPVWGLDDEGEVRGCYRPSGHPGLWFVGGDFYNGRVGSQQLALEIKAIELGLMKL